MKEISKELFYKIIVDNNLDVVVSCELTTHEIISFFKFRNRLLFGKVVEDRLSRCYPLIEKYYISEYCYEKYNVEKNE